MPLDTYANLQASILTWLARPGDPLVSPSIPDIIELFEREANRRLRVGGAEKRASLTALSAAVALPADFGELRLATSGGVNLTYVTPMQLPPGDGPPAHYTIIGNEMRLGPSPSGGCTIEIVYQIGVPPLSDTNVSNWLLAAHPDCYLFGSLVEAESFIRSDERVPLWAQRREAAFASIETADRKARWGGAPLSIRAEGVSGGNGTAAGDWTSAPPVPIPIAAIVAGDGLTGGGTEGIVTIALDTPVDVAHGGTGSTTGTAGPYLPLAGGTLGGNLQVNAALGINTAPQVNLDIFSPGPTGAVQIKNVASISAGFGMAIGASQAGLWCYENLPLVLGANNVEGLRLPAAGGVTTTGNVQINGALGINTAPQVNLDIVSPGPNVALTLKNSGTGTTVNDGLAIAIGLSQVGVWSYEALPLVLATNNVEGLRLPAAGGVTTTGKLTTAASAAGGAGFNLPQGAAPTAPANGDIWTTATSVFARINAVTVDLATNQAITLSGDVTGSGTTAITATLPNVNATVGSFTNATITVNAKGQVTAASNGAAGGGGLSGMTAGQIPIAATATTVTSSGNLSGDITTAGSLATTLATVNANVGTFQGLTLDGKGRVTAAANQSYLTASGVSGMTAGQIPIAATATTITSSGNLSGAVTTSGSLATTLAANAVATANITNANVTYAKIQNVAANRLLGNSTGSAAAPAEIALPLTVSLGGTGVTSLAIPAFTGAAAGFVYGNGTGAMIPSANWGTKGDPGLSGYGAGTTPYIDFGSAGGGTLASPTATLTNNVLGTIQWNGRGATAWSTGGRAAIDVLAAENWSNTAQGTVLRFSTTAVTTATLTGNAYLWNDGSFQIGGSTATKPGGGAWVAPSSRDLKQDIVPYERGLEAVLRLNPVVYGYNGKGGLPTGVRYAGLIADEVEPVMPELVSSVALPSRAAGGESLTVPAIDPSDLIYALVNAVKELSAKVAALDGKPAA